MVLLVLVMVKVVAEALAAIMAGKVITALMAVVAASLVAAAVDRPIFMIMILTYLLKALTALPAAALSA
jgi:hypothetical protein